MVRADTVNQQGGASTYLITEAVFEAYRVRHCPTAISRLEAAFFFDDLQKAVEFANARRCMTYEVVLANPAAPVEVRSFDAIHFPPVGATVLPSLEGQAREYWGGNTSATMEYLTTSPLKVIARIP